MHKKRNEYLRGQGMKIKSSLSTANSAIGNIVVDTFADEKGLYALLSSALKMLSMVTYDGEKPSTNKSTNTRTVGVAVGVTVRYR